MSSLWPCDCYFCKNLFTPVGKKKKCKAFPSGIPKEIWVDLFDHSKPFPGDNGIRFEQISNGNDVREHPLLENQ